MRTATAFGASTIYCSTSSPQQRFKLFLDIPEWQLKRQVASRRQEARYEAPWLNTARCNNTAPSDGRNLRRLVCRNQYGRYSTNLHGIHSTQCRPMCTVGTAATWAAVAILDGRLYVTFASVMTGERTDGDLHNS